MEIPTGFAQVNFLFGGGAFPTGAEVTLGLDVQGFIGTPQDAADTALTHWAATIRLSQTSALTLLGTSIKYGPTATGPSAVSAGPFAGGLSDDPSPSAVAMLVRKLTAAGGRAGRGRMFVPGLGDAQIGTGGAILGSYRTTMQGHLDDFMTAMNGDDLTPVLLHNAGSPIAVPTEITSLQLDSTAATQRRRQRR